MERRRLARQVPLTTQSAVTVTDQIAFSCSVGAGRWWKQPQGWIEKYNGSRFPSFNSTPFPADGPVINADGSSEKETAKQIDAEPFDQYDLSFPESADNPRTPFATSPPEPPLPERIGDVPMQVVINDPIRLLQAVIEKQKADECTFEGSALNIATLAPVMFRVNPDSPAAGPTLNIWADGSAGGSRTSFSWREASRQERRGRTPRPGCSTRPSGSRRSRPSLALPSCSFSTPRWLSLTSRFTSCSILRRKALHPDCWDGPTFP